MPLIVGENKEMTFDPVSMFSATHTDVCPLTGSLKAEGCENEQTGTEITMSGSGSVYTLSMMKLEPGTETVCFKFTNGRDTKTLELKVQACNQVPGFVQSIFAHN
jgi:hypothetical protein